MSREHFLARINNSNPADLAQAYLLSPTAHIFSAPEKYASFKAKVNGLIGDVETVSVVGSANWRYSLNPDKNLREFGEHSDVDVAIISSTHFFTVWQEMRSEHRRHFYGLSHDDKLRLRRNSENVYAGFISPEWIPRRTPSRAYEYRRLLNSLSDQSVRFLKVKMLFFRNQEEATDYYARGFRAARGKKK